MNVVTHAFSPVIIAALAETLFFRRRGKRLLTDRHFCAIAISGAAPDLLWPHLTLAARYSSPTHSIWFLLAAIPIAILLTRRLFRETWRLTTFLLICAVAFHLFCDAIANGIAWAYPFSDHVIGVSLVPHWTWIWIDILCLGVAVALIYGLRIREKSRLSKAESIP
ncbi:MAG: hypothetical protein ACI8UO_006804 [Verrucomicrobiales bacterium]|jgi:hypothetical protein